MRAALAALLCSFPLHAEGFDLELAPGWLTSTDISASAPVVRARAGWETEWLTPSVSAMLTLSDPGPAVHFGQDGGIKAWGFAAELRAHTRGQLRFFAALGAGAGRLSVLQAENVDMESLHGVTAPYVEAAVGADLDLGTLRLGLALTADFFNRVHSFGDLVIRSCVDEASGPYGQFCPTGQTYRMIGVALTVSRSTN